MANTTLYLNTDSTSDIDRRHFRGNNLREMGTDFKFILSTGPLGERNRAFLALYLLLVGEVASENLAIFASNVLGIFIVQLLKKMPR